MASYSVPKNNLRDQRETALGWTMQQLVDFAKSKHIQLSTKTLGRVEQGTGTFARVTLARLLRVVNAARVQESLPAINEDELFPTIKLGKGK